MKTHLKLFAYAILLCFLINPSVLIGQATQNSQKTKESHLTKSFAVFEDKNGTISNDSMFNGSIGGKFKPLKTNKFYAGTTKSTFWLKTTLFDIGNAAGFLEVDAPYLSSVTLFRVNQDGSIEEWQNGMEIMPNDREVQSGSIGFKITPQDENEHLYLRIRAESIISFSIRFYSPNQWSNYQSWRRTILIIFVTLFLLLSFGCIILWLMRREAMFLYYFGAVISFSAITLYTYGFANELWQFHYLPSFILSFIAICLLCLFGIFRSLLSLLNRPRERLIKYIRIGMIIFLGYSILYVLIRSEWLIIPMFILFVLSTLFLVVASAYLRYKGVKSMTIFLIGCALLLLSVLTRGYDIFASDVLSHTFKIVPVLFVVGQMVLFLLGFVYQSNIHQKARLSIEMELQESLSKLEYYRLKLEQRLHDENDGSQHKFPDRNALFKLPEPKFNKILITPLSSREQEVLLQVSRGLSNQETADLLFISINTVKTHLLRIYEKLDVKNRTEAAIRAGEMNLLN